MPAEIIHSQEGLVIKRNEKNKFVVARLHYTSDPDKRSEQWLAEAKAGVPESKFRKEYEIEWDALDGQKVFPEILTYRHKIVIPDGVVEFDEHQQYWAGYDHGVRNPSAFIVFTKDKEGTIYAVWEMIEPCANLVDYVAKLKRCPYWNRIKYIAADPSFKQKRGYDLDGVPVSPYEMFCAQGVKNIIWGSRDEQAWLLMMRTYWGNPDDIQFKIFESCQNLIQEFEGARYPNMAEAMLSQSNFKETMVDKNNHAMDASKYWMLTQRRLQQRTFNYRTMVDRYRYH